MKPIYPCLWFTDNAQEAVNFYLSVFPDAKIIHTACYGENMHRPAGTVLTIIFELLGHRYMALNGGELENFNHSVSFVLPCDTQAEIDHYWEKLGDGGQVEQCGWLRDKYGLCWQIAPANFPELISKGNDAQGQRVMQAVMQMIKLDLAEMQAAAKG